MSDRPPRRSLLRMLPLLLPTLLLSVGCLDWSSDVKRYRKVLDGEHPQAIAPFDPSADLPLTRALVLANADNESIAARGEQWIQALADKMRAAGTFLPTLTISPGYDLTHTKGQAFVGTTSGGVVTTVVRSNVSDQTSIPFNASVNGSLTNVSNLQASGRTAEQQKQLMLDEQQNVLLQVAQAYYTVLKAERQADVYEHGLQLKTEKVRDQEARLKLGNVRPLDLAQSQSDLSATRVSLTQAHTDAANARSALARLMGVSAVNGKLVDAFLPPAEIPTVDDWQAAAQKNRQDLLAAARATEAARLSLEAAIREYFPSVGINFSYFLYNDPTSSLDWAAAISANIPLFSALQIEADVRRAWSGYRAAGLLQSQTNRQVIDDIQENFQNLEGSREKIKDLNIEVDAAQRAFDLAERAYRLGSESNLDRLTQQDNLLTAQLTLVSEQFNEKTSYLGLLRAEGKLSTLLKSGN